VNIHSSIKSDLHLHTTASDGLLHPEALVKLAIEVGLDVIAITDHDTVDGVLPALWAAGNSESLSVVPGVEISTALPHNEVHVLGYFIDFERDSFLQALAELRNSREVRARQMIQKLDAMNIKIKWENLMQIARDSTIGRPHMAQALLQAGYVNSFQEAFEKYIGKDGPAYVEHKKMKPAEVVRFIGDSDGIPVLAHPDNIIGLETLIVELKGAGLVGLETYYNGYSDETRQRLLGLCRKYDLLPTGGTDYHGFHDKAETMIGDSPVPAESVVMLYSMAQKTSGQLLKKYKFALPGRQ
jgi:predicted metal-dependent phosphoesterase TrpH